jgi:hypothetical protein
MIHGNAPRQTLLCGARASTHQYRKVLMASYKMRDEAHVSYKAKSKFVDQRIEDPAHEITGSQAINRHPRT